MRSSIKWRAAKLPWPRIMRISYFNCGTMQTLPIAIYSMTRKKVSPEINALSAIIFLVILAIILTSNAMDSRAYKRNQKAIRRAAAEQ